MLINKNDFAYDVFISYRQKEPDKSWVHNILLPRLESEAIKVFIDFRDFRLGYPIVAEMGRAVEQSRFTVAILTPAYLESNYTELENILAEHSGLEIGIHRLLVIMREKCQPRIGIRARLWLDMTNEKEIDQNFLRLLSHIKKHDDLLNSK